MNSAELTETIKNAPDFETRFKAMADRAEYEIGDRSWAGTLLGAFLYPHADAEALQRAMGD